MVGTRVCAMCMCWKADEDATGRADSGTYCMTCGQDKVIRLWNPHRAGLDRQDCGLLVKQYKGPHGYEIQDVAM